MVLCRSMNYHHSGFVLCHVRPGTSSTTQKQRTHYVNEEIFDQFLCDIVYESQNISLICVVVVINIMYCR